MCNIKNSINITGLDNVYVNKIKDHYVCFNTSENSKIALINKQTKKLLDKLKRNDNYRLYDKEEKAAIKKLVHSLILSANGASKQVAYNKHSTFCVWLQLTDRCNMNCPYCSVPGKKSVNLDLRLFKTNIKKIYRHAGSLGHNKINLRIAGGEPLLNYSALKSVIDISQELDAEAFEYLIITNGTVLNKRIIELLVRYKIEVYVSLDGTGEYHNRTRAFKNGRPSFEIIDKNLDILKENKIYPAILSVIHKNNLDNMNDLFDFLYGRELNFRFNPVRIVYKDKAHIEKDNREFIGAFNKLFLHIKKNMPPKLISRFFTIGNSFFNLGCKEYYHCSILDSFIAYHNNGNYYSCLEGITDQRFRVRFDKNGQVLPYCHNSTAENIRFDNIEECSDCTWKYICRGGCPVIKYKIWGRFDVPSERCSFYKAVLPAYVNLIGHQIYHLHKMRI